MAARTVINPDNPVRRTVDVAMKVTGHGLRRRIFSTAIVQEDVIVNQTKAYLYYLALAKKYDRPETISRLKSDLLSSPVIL